MIPAETFCAYRKVPVWGLCGLLILLSAPGLRAQIVPPPRAGAAGETPPTGQAGVYLVTFRTGTPASERAAAVQASGAVLRVAYAVVNAASVHVPNAAALARLQNDPRVLTVVADQTIHLHQGPGNGNGNGGGPGGGGGGGKPKAPSGLSAAAVSTSRIALSWTDGSNNETGFRLERCAGAGCSSFAQVAEIGANTTQYEDGGLGAGQLYRYRVLAYNSSGASKYSNVAEAATQAEPTPPPAAPSGLTAAAVSSSQINLSWTDNSANEDGFRVERCTGAAATCGSADFLQIAQLGSNTTSYSSTGLQAETTYTFRVRAFNGNGASEYSNAAAASTPASPPSSQIVPGGVQRIGAAPGMMNWTGAGVGVAVVDTGLDYAHADLGLEPEVIGVNSFNAFGGSCNDIYGHGTHVAGIIGARDNSIDVVGVAPEATIYCVNVFRSDPVYGVVATDESLIAGLDWIASNANAVEPPIRVVNMSLGRAKTIGDTATHPLRLAVKALHDNGISVVVSAGNDPLTEVSEQVPASYPEVMAVASTTARDGINGYDDFFGPCVGEQIIRKDTASYFTTDGAFIGGTGVTVSAPGEEQENIFIFQGTCYLDPIGIVSTAMGGGTIALYGTSMAAPHVAGVAALMWEKELSLGLNLSPETARSRLRSGVDRLGTAPLNSPIVEYTFDGEREGVVWAPAAVGDAPPPPPDFPPAVSIQSPANGATFASGATILFQGTATDPEQGDLSSSLAWSSSRDGAIGSGASFSRVLTDGSHVITATVSDAGGNVASASVSITVGSSSGASTVQVSSVTYALQGNDLLSTVRLVNEFGNAVAGAQVSVILMEWLYTGQVWSGGGTTSAQGNVTFRISNAPIGCYLTEVQSIEAAGLTWQGGTPSNYTCK